jgi:hypothetical protein
MRKAIFYICSLLVSISSLGQEVIIGTGTSTTSTNPINSFYGYNYTQQIYTSAEITAGGGTAGQSITKIKFYWAGGGNLTNANTWVVYLGNTTQATFSDGTNWVALGSLTQVYNGVVTLPASAGWMTITLTTPYVWTGNNLVVAIDENVASYASTAATWRYTSTSANYRSIYYYSDVTNPDPAAPPSGTRTYNRPNVTLVFPAMDQNWPGENLGTLSCPSTTTYTGSTAGAVDNCTYSVGADHIYSFTVGYNFDATISLCNAGTNFDTKLYLYNITNGSCNDGSYVAYNDDGGAGCSLESEISVTGLSAGTYVVVIEGFSGATGNYEMDITLSNCGLAGDNCTNAQNLASLTSPFSGTTVGYTDDIATCQTGYPDRIFYVDVANGCSVDIWESTNNYDEYEYMGYGATCPGTTTINCWDNDVLAHNIWTNTTGSTQRVWYIQDGYSGSGTFTLNWAVTCCAAPNSVTASVSSSTVYTGDNVTFSYVSHTGGACGTGVWEYQWEDNIGNVLQSWSTSANYITSFSVAGSYTYYLRMRCSGCTATSTLSNAVNFSVGIQSNCSNAIDLATLSPPYNATTVNYSNDFSLCTMGSSPDRFFYIDVDPNCIISIWQISNNYDSRHTMRYSGACPGSIQIGCIDEPDNQVITWTNTTGVTQRVWWINAGYGSGSGDFVLDWTLSCCYKPTSVTASVSSSSVYQGNNVTLNYSSHTGGLCSGSWEYEWRTSTGTVLQSWSTTSSLTQTMSSIGTFTYYLYMRCSACPTEVTQSNAVTVTVSCLPPANPANPTASANACGDKTLSFTGTPPAGVTWYWQSACNGTSTANSSSSTTVSTSGTYYLTAYNSSNSCWSSGCGLLSVSVEQIPPIPSINDTTVCVGENILTAYGSGTCVTYNWYNAASGGTLLNSGATYDVSITSPTTYYVEAANSGSFEVTLQSTNSYVVDHNTATGDDRGGIAITPNYLYVTGDSYTTRFDLPLSLLTGTSFTIKDGLFSDLANGDLWELYNGSSPISGITLTGYNVTSLRKLNQDLAYTGTTLTLSSSFTVGDEGGIYVGKGFVIIQDGDTDNFYHIDLSTGTVTSLGIFTTTGRSFSESWATWGIAEFNGCSFSVLYANNLVDQISRIDLSDGTITTASTFTNISDMSSFTLSPWENRWYFHHEYSGQFGGLDETAGYADATITETTGNCSSSRDNFTVSVTSPPSTPIGNAFPPAVNPGGEVILQASGSGGTIIWYDDKCNGNIIGTGSTLAVNPPYTTYYYVAIFNGCYSECDSVPVQVVQPCNVYAYANGVPGSISICSGDAVDISAAASCDYMMNNDFNDGTVGVGWSSNASPMFNNPCGAGVDGSPYLWIGSATDFPRELITQPYTVTEQCKICFNMKYATQTGSSGTDCEGPDLPGEGVHIQYSTNGGTTWTDIQYYDPNGGYDPQYTNWNHYCLFVPAGGASASTQFRFFQDVTSGYDFDHWGLDDVEISCPGSGMVAQWSHGPTVLDPAADVFPTTSTTYTVIVDDGFNLGNADTSSVYVQVLGAPEVTDAQVCSIGGEAVLVATGGSDYTWYDAPTGGSIVGTGPTLTIDPLNSDQTYWVEFTATVFSPLTYDFNTSAFSGWALQNPCGSAVNWAFFTDGGVNGLYAIDYSSGSSQMIVSPTIDVSGYDETIEFSFTHKFNTEGCCDKGYIAYSLDGGAWQPLTLTTGSYTSTSGLSTDPIDGCAYTSPTVGVFSGSQASYTTHAGQVGVGGINSIRFAFVFSTDGSVGTGSGYTGWYIDQAVITGVGGGGSCPLSRAEANATVSSLNSDFLTETVSCVGNNDGEMSAIAVDELGNAIPGIFSYQWSNGATSQTVIDVPSGIYTVTITDAFGCTSSTSVSVIGPSMPSQIVSVSGISGTCNIESPDNWVYIVNSSNSDELIASVFDPAGGNNLFLTTAEATILPSVQYSGSMPYLQRVVRVTPISSGSALVRIYFTNAEFAALQVADPTITSVADLAVTKCDDSGVWVNCLLLTPSTFGVSPIGTGYYAEVSVTSFSKFYIHKDNGWVLPVELVNFSSVCEGDMLRIKWATASEKNNSHFVLEKSIDLENFEEIAVIEGAGNSDIYKNYEILVNNFDEAVSYYRLKQVDYDGAFEYSEFISVNCKESNSEIDFSAYAEANGEILLFVSGNNVENNKFDLVLMDLTGRILSNQKIVVNSENQKFTISNLDLSAGIYNLVLRNEMRVITKSVVVVK